MSWGECGDKVEFCSDELRKAKAKLGLNMARHTKKSRKSFYGYVNQKRKVKEGAAPLVSHFPP